MTSLANRIKTYLGDDAVDRLVTYYRAKPGGRFDTLAEGGDRDGVRNVITYDDIVAVSLLGVNIPGRAALRLLDYRPGLDDPRLDGIPFELDLADAEEADIDSESMADRYWNHLKAIDGIGWVTAGKLLARKRPRLIPVFDSVVESKLFDRHTDRWWLSLREVLRENPDIVDRLRELKTLSRIPVQVSFLRVLDVAIWMTSQS